MFRERVPKEASVQGRSLQRINLLTKHTKSMDGFYNTCMALMSSTSEMIYVLVQCGLCTLRIKRRSSNNLDI